MYEAMSKTCAEGLVYFAFMERNNKIIASKLTINYSKVGAGIGLPQVISS